MTPYVYGKINWKNQDKIQDDFFLPMREYIELPLQNLEVLTTLKREKKKKKLN